MDPKVPLVRNISDTAMWAAVYRAQESERPDAAFHDPFARRLAGKRGQDIATAQPFHQQNSWSWIARTWLFDQLLLQEIQEGAGMVVNLAAGLDARPYRLKVPRSLTWIEVDLPEILDYKQAVIGDAAPRCRLERVALDLRDSTARSALFEEFAAKGTRAVILSEGLLIYLTPEEVGELAADLARNPVFQTWVLDLASPGLLQMLRGNTHLDDAGTLQFAPANGPRFFVPHGWRTRDVQSLIRTAAKLERLPSFMLPMAQQPEDPENMGPLPWAGVCRLRNNIGLR